MLEVSFHIEHASAADGTTIGAPNMFMVALLVDTVTAFHEYYLFWGCEHVVAADWTVAIGGSLDTAMRLCDLDLEAYTACLVIA